MPFYLKERYFEETPYLLASRGKQHLISPGPAGELLLETGIGSTWDEPRPLPQRGERYCAALDTDHRPHLLIMEQGNFYHQILSPLQVEGTAALFYREESKRCSHFLITGAEGGALHFICLALDPAADRWWLLHHRFSGGAWEEPRVIDFGSGASENYGNLAVDTRGCLHLIYRIAGAGRADLNYRYFDPGDGHWSEALSLSTSAPVEYPSIAVDEAQNLHVLWRTLSGGKYFICYRFMGGPGWKAPGWRPETVISPGMAEPPYPFISYRFGELLICWLENSALHRYLFSEDRWDRIEPQHFENPLPIRVKSLSPAGVPLNYRILAESGNPALNTPLSSLLPADEGCLDRDFSKLHRYSGELIGRISHLSTAKAQLEEEVKAKSKEMLHFSRQSEKSMRLLRRNLDDKDAELKKLQENFDLTLGAMKQKIEQSRLTGEAEKKRNHSELQELKKERRRIEKIIQEKEKKISGLESRIREQQYRIEKLSEENEILIRKRTEGWNVKNLWQRIIPQKKP